MVSNSSITDISPERVKEAIDNKEKVTILDVRTIDEFKRGHLEGSIQLSLDDLTQNISLIVPDKHAHIYVYCLSGARSVPAVSYLLKIGYTNAYNMPSGLLAWRQRGFPLTTK